MPTMTNSCKTFAGAATAVILTLLIGGDPARAQEDIDKLPIEVQDALRTIAAYLGKGEIAITDVTSIDTNGNISHDMLKDTKLVQEVSSGTQQINTTVETLGTSVDMTVTISASPDCELRIRNGRYYWYPKPPCPQ